VKQKLHKWLPKYLLHTLIHKVATRFTQQIFHYRAIQFSAKRGLAIACHPSLRAYVRL